MGISLANAQFLSLALTTFLYGLFFMLFLVTTAVLSLSAAEDLRCQRTKILPVTFLMLVVATLHIVLLWVRGKNGFVEQRGGSTILFYENIADITNVLQTGCLLLQSLLGDGVIIWRLYVVYGKRAWVVVPAIVLVLAYTAVGCVAFQFIVRARLGTDIFHVATSWITAYFALTMCTNVLCSGAIAWRIFHAGKPLKGARRTLWPVIFIIVESSALYALGVITVLACFLSGSNAQYPAVDAIVPLVGIVFSLIVLQIRFHVSSTASHRSGDGQHSTNGGTWPRAPPGAHDPEYPMRSIRMAVHVTRQTHTHLSTQDVVRDSSSDDGVEKPTAL